MGLEDLKDEDILEGKYFRSKSVCWGISLGLEVLGLPWSQYLCLILSMEKEKNLVRMWKKCE